MKDGRVIKRDGESVPFAALMSDQFGRFSARLAPDLWSAFTKSGLFMHLASVKLLFTEGRESALRCLRIKASRRVF